MSIVELSSKAKTLLLRLFDGIDPVGFVLKVKPDNTITIAPIVSINESLLNTVMVHDNPLIFTHMGYLHTVRNINIDFDENGLDFIIKDNSCHSC